MTRRESEERRKRIHELRQQGKSYAEIGAALGLSRQRIPQLLNPHDRIRPAQRMERYIFPNIARWMNENNVTLKKIADYGGYGTTTVSHYLTGKTDPTLRFINIMIEMSGLPFEVAFERKEEQ